MNVTDIYNKARRPSEVIALQRKIIGEQEAIIDVLKAALAADGIVSVAEDPTWMEGLGRQERALLAALHRHYPRVLNKYDLLEMMPGRDFVDDRLPSLVNTKVCFIRKKLGADAIESVRGVGYRLGDAMYRRMQGDVAPQKLRIAHAA